MVRRIGSGFTSTEGPLRHPVDGLRIPVAVISTRAEAIAQMADMAMQMAQLIGRGGTGGDGDSVVLGIG